MLCILLNMMATAELYPRQFYSCCLLEMNNGFSCLTSYHTRDTPMQKQKTVCHFPWESTECLDTAINVTVSHCYCQYTTYIYINYTSPLCLHRSGEHADLHHKKRLASLIALLTALLFYKACPQSQSNPNQSVTYKEKLTYLPILTAIICAVSCQETWVTDSTKIKTNQIFNFKQGQTVSTLIKQKN